MTPMKSPTMLYQKGTQERIHDTHVDWIIVDEHEVEDYLAAGWFRTPKEVASGEHADAAERRAAEQAATEAQLKDQRIAELEAELARRNAEAPRRGRPPNAEREAGQDAS
ncbi:hypothetical protein [Burkholderia gladioli]|uniref:DUF2635 domain-containing protein n=1 Tax=Burkholderia gladioli TaxID=28095 RepID=A0AB38U5Y4_BURGA|nr:hypothetical protein [Burkholderia gladioli]UWX75368.1 hypothetical protein NYZ96_35075 [Burkholderia gladioli]